MLEFRFSISVLLNNFRQEGISVLHPVIALDSSAAWPYVRSCRYPRLPKIEYEKLVMSVLKCKHTAFRIESC